MGDDIPEETINKRLEERRRDDLKDLIRIILDSPLKDKGKVAEADGEISLSELSKKNTNVMTRIVMSMANSAARGEVKPAELLFRYGGYEPIKEQNININTPNLIDDMTCRAVPVVAADLGDDDEEDESEDE